MFGEWRQRRTTQRTSSPEWSIVVGVLCCVSGTGILIKVEGIMKIEGCVKILLLSADGEHQCQRCQQEQQSHSQGWKHHYPVFGGVWASEGQEVTYSNLYDSFIVDCTSFILNPAIVNCVINKISIHPSRVLEAVIGTDETKINIYQDDGKR